MDQRSRYHNKVSYDMILYVVQYERIIYEYSLFVCLFWIASSAESSTYVSWTVQISLEVMVRSSAPHAPPTTLRAFFDSPG
jgi:hypothetical protein